MEALDREIEEAARKILRRGWTPPNNFLQIDRGLYILRKSHGAVGISFCPSKETEGTRMS